MRKEDFVFVKNIMFAALPSKVQCSNEKAGKYFTKMPKFYAIESYNFIQFDHPKKFQFISIDIDSREKFKTEIDIYSYCSEFGVPYPTIIVETNKGWHLHWYLQQPVWKNNPKLIKWKKELTKKLNELFGGDINAVGKIFRNPIQHTFYALNEKYEYSAFNSLLKLEDIKVKKKTKYTKEDSYFRGKKYINFAEVKTGTRNNTLLQYMRGFIFRNYGISLDNAISEAYRVNELMPEPLPKDEVRRTVNSAYKFCDEHYNPKKINKEQNKYNRQLAKYKKHKSFAKLYENLKNAIKTKTLSVSDLFFNRLSLNFISTIAKLDRRTVRKNIKKVIRWLIKLLKLKTVEIENELIFSFKTFQEKYLNKTKECISGFT